ncbi:MAG: 4'-phosphopantetheinyl transferase superfamily protein [Deltaproteobacteria bacterium]|nr:4'-phosphopantetheinyl transferase superfamily protein [Deltaproteobacteria bacterium]MBK8715709.1 4'-phosphopantetheinyl transferase superfamily protein [Deltaproteobacteria bacterium]
MVVHVFVEAIRAPLVCTAGAATLDEAVRVLDDGEIARMRTLAFEADRLRYAAAHLLLRRALTQLQPGREAHAWRFVRGPYDRPVLHPSHPERVSFSLTHTAGVVACAVADATLEVGIDAESFTRAAPLELAAAKFAAAEREWLAVHDGEARARAFYELWTLKEAYLKARGLGLALPLDSLTVVPGDPPRIELAAELHDDAARWSLSLRRHADAVVAIAVGRRTAAQPPPRLVWHPG